MHRFLHKCLFLVEATGLAPLAARPAPTLSTSDFASKFRVFPSFVRQSVLLPQNGSHPQVPSQRRNNKKIQHINDVLYFLVEATGLEPTTFWSLRHKRKFFIYFPSISKSFVSATDAFLYSSSHCFHVVQIRKWSNMWSFRLHVKNGCKKSKTTYPCTYSFVCS